MSQKWNEMGKNIPVCSVFLSQYDIEMKDCLVYRDFKYLNEV